MLNEARLRETLCETTEAHSVFQETLKEVYQDLYRLGLAPAQRLNAKKNNKSATAAAAEFSKSTESFGMVLNVSD